MDVGNVPGIPSNGLLIAKKMNQLYVLKKLFFSKAVLFLKNSILFIPSRKNIFECKMCFLSKSKIVIAKQNNA